MTLDADVVRGRGAEGAQALDQLSRIRHSGQTGLPQTGDVVARGSPRRRRHFSSDAADVGMHVTDARFDFPHQRHAIADLEQDRGVAQVQNPPRR